MGYIILCPVCGKFPVDPEDCGCVAEELAQRGKWRQFIVPAVRGQLRFNLEDNNGNGRVDNQSAI